MKCERALEILYSIKNKVDIITSYEEISELFRFNLILEFFSQGPSKHLEYDIKGLKSQFITLSSEIRASYKNIISMEGEYKHLSIFKKLLAHLRIGIGHELKSELKELQHIIEDKEIQVKNLKNQILQLNSEKEAIERAVKVNGKKVTLTPIGDTMINEIRARRRFYFRELSELIDILNRLDVVFTDIITQVGNLMRKNSFSPIWALYLINIDMLNLSKLLNTITMSEYKYDTAQKRMMILSFYLMNHPDVLTPKSKHEATSIEKQLKFRYHSNNPKEQINELLDRTNYPTNSAKRAISLLGKLFSIRYDKNIFFKQEIDTYLENLEILVEYHSNLPMIGKETLLYKHLKSSRDEEMVHVLLILALSTHLDSYNYFFELMQDIPDGTKFFSSVCSLFPWDPEETWMIMLRAQSKILKAQSAKFIPELIEYSLLMSLNPMILSIANNVSKEELERWKNIIIPIIQLSIYSYLEKDLETYIRRRPLAYIIAPRYYIYSSLHYHSIG